jgi:LemA protein
MNGLYVYLIGFVAFCLLGAAYAGYTYNRLSRLQVQLKEALGNIDLFLDQRQGILESVTPLLDQLSAGSRTVVAGALDDLRATASEAPADMPGRAQRLSASDQSSRKVKHQLQADHLPATARVLDSIDRSETELNGARRYYNALVREHNALVHRFPSALVALLLRIREREFLNDQPA